MNRAQRRSGKMAKPAKAQPYMGSSMPMNYFNLTLAKADQTLAGEEDADELTLSPLVNIERLSIGTLNDEGFIDLNEANVAGFCLGKRIFEFSANQGTKDIIAQAQPYFEAAADALGEIGHRKMKLGRYVAKGDELEAIRESLNLYRQAILVSEKGHIMHALIRAKELVNDKLLRVWRENEMKAA